MNNQLIISIIPVHGNIARILTKNIRPIAGKPLLAYSIEDALETPGLKRVFVSTDDSEIADIAIEFGAEVIRRPKEINRDMVRSESVLLHALDHLRETESLEPELVVSLQATTPLRQPDDIQNAIETLLSEQADSLFSACLMRGLVWRKEGEKLSSITHDDQHRMKLQNIHYEDMIENGSIYIFKPWVLRNNNYRLGGKITVYRMHELDSFRVKEPEDLEFMEQLIARRHSNKKKPDLQNIHLLVLDFDGVLTDNRVCVDQKGREAVWCHRGDSLGIEQLKERGIEVLVLSKETNPVVAARCQKLGIDCVYGCNDKLSALQDIVKQRTLEPGQVAYVGNDINDRDCLKWVGAPIAVADAVPQIKAICRLITTKSGGRGAVREVADLILGIQK